MWSTNEEISSNSNTILHLTVRFAQQQQQWHRTFDVENGSTIRDIKAAMLKCSEESASEDDINAFELRHLGRRIPDFEKIHEQGPSIVDFAFLGPTEGALRAQEDMQKQAAWTAKPVRSRYESSRPVAAKPQTTAASPSPASPAEPLSQQQQQQQPQQTPPPQPTQSKEAIPFEFPKPQPAPRPPVPDEDRPPKGDCWEVIGGTAQGGILVREGRSTSSKQLPERLATGALIEELSREGERLQYRRLRGSGPNFGWVSVTISGKELLTSKTMSAEDLFSLDRALALQEDLMEGFARPDFQMALHKLIQEHPGKSGAAFLKKRTELFLSVQSQVLPKYGFEGSASGVVRMMAAFARHNGSKEMEWNNHQLNMLLQM